MSTSATSGQMLYVNGLDVDTGDYLVTHGYLTPDQIAPVAKMEDASLTEAEVASLQEKASPTGRLAIRPGHDPCKLRDAGWGVIWAPDVGQDVRDALQPLLDLRCGQAGERYCQYPDSEHRIGYAPGMDGHAFLQQYQVRTGPADPAKMPYYLLLVGSPKSIPFSFQHQLDVDRAVGRLDFATAGEYAQYAASVVRAEAPAAAQVRRAAFFSVQNDDDESTRLSHELLTSELYRRFSSDEDLSARWALEFVSPEVAKKPMLAQYLGGAHTPALLFTASHGAGFSQWNLAAQQARQGALVCGEWPGSVKWKQAGGGRIPESAYFWEDDLGSDAKVAGMVAVFFACYSAGTPDRNDFIHRRDLNEFEKTTVAAEPFVSGLARRLLAHPNGAALAVVGHVDRAWDTAFTEVMWDPVPGAEQRKISAPDSFEDLLKCLMNGQPVGLAMESMNLRYSSLSTMLTDEFDMARKYNRAVDAVKIAPIWTANNDARNYVIVGDPAVRLYGAHDSGTTAAGRTQ